MLDFQNPNSPTILKKILCLSHQDFVIWKLHNFWLAKPHGLANQKLCYIQMLLNEEKNLENKTENVIKKGWRNT